jgi:hypothetical protein
MWAYDPTQAGELFEQDGEAVECKACATHLHNPTQQQLREHAEEIKETAGKKGSCRGFWESSFPERFRDMRPGAGHDRRPDPA